MLWEQADAAPYEGKRRGGDRVVLFDDVADASSTGAFLIAEGIETESGTGPRLKPPGRTV